VSEDADRDAIAEFDRHYRLGEAPARRRVEQAVLGSDYGATSYTTVSEAADLAHRLRLGPGITLLDLGAGSGWPGLHLAATTGCRVVLVDQPEAGLRVARERAVIDDLADRCRFVRASGDRLPFRPKVFDAITHADILC
jgi:SAM-dependent methyltransferase